MEKSKFYGFRTNDDAFARQIEKGIDALKKETGLSTLNESDFMRRAVNDLLTKLKIKK